MHCELCIQGTEEELSSSLAESSKSDSREMEQTNWSFCCPHTEYLKAIHIQDCKSTVLHKYIMLG